jgi:excinuclease ABC subunit A
VAQGTPEQVAGTKGSHTGRFLSGIVKPPPARKKRTGRAKMPAAA